MTPPDVSLAVLARMVHWQLDDMCRDLPAGRADPGQCAQLADNMDHLARLLRRVGSIDSGGPPAVQPSTWDNPQ